MRRVVRIALVGWALVIAGAEADRAGVAIAATPTPARAASREASCLRAAGWKATAHGRKVSATGRRVRTTDSLRHPWYRAQWVDFGGIIKPIEAFAGVNDREHVQIAHCRSKAQR